MVSNRLTDEDIQVIEDRVRKACKQHYFTREEVEDVVQDTFVRILEGSDDDAAINNAIGQHRRTRDRERKRFEPLEDEKYE